MQPILAITAAHPGLLYINGQFSGEVGEEALLRPVAARGAVYLEYRPFPEGLGPTAQRMVFSGGLPLEESIEGCELLRALLWPGGLCEIELLPQRLGPPGRSSFSAAGRALELEHRPHETLLYCSGRRVCSLLPDISVPEYRPMQGGAALMGSCADGMYLLALDHDLSTETGFLCAQQIETGPGDRIRALSAKNDLVGHAMMEEWQLTPDGLALVSAEAVWANGAPDWPQTPAETARAAVEAALAGLDVECEGYLTPALRSRTPFAGIQSRCDLCVEMKFAAPDARPAVGLLRLKGSSLAVVDPLYFRTVPSGGVQGPYQLSEVEFSALQP